MNTSWTTYRDLPWNAWVLSNVQVGLLVLDEQGRVVFVNKWFLQHAGLQSADMIGRDLFAVFPQLKGQYFESVLARTQRSGFPTLMSQSLHQTPFPLYAPSAQRDQDKLLQQSIRIVPMAKADAATLGQRFTLIQVTDVTAAILRERLLKAQATKLQSMANLDVLTNLGNRRYLDDTLASELKAANRSRGCVAVIMFDIDYFKQYNDHYGHLAGDECLRRVAQVLRTVCKRPRDSVARYGGEEMVAILPGTDEAGAARVAEQVLQSVRDLHIPHAASRRGVFLTISAGVAVSDAGHPVNAETLLRHADRALYAAKTGGRDRLTVYSATDSALSPLV
ncbi:MAG: hypothetical protein Fur007_14910 [Rhodoferax sp.]